MIIELRTIASFQTAVTISSQHTEHEQSQNSFCTFHTEAVGFSLVEIWKKNPGSDTEISLRFQYLHLAASQT